MTDEPNNNQEEASGLDRYQETMEEFLSAADVRVVYGEPIQHGDTTIIPTAEVLCGLGFGVGSGSGTDTEHPWEVAAVVGAVGGFSPAQWRWWWPHQRV
jgi:uncharacterized spore protein YtfJ